MTINYAAFSPGLEAHLRVQGEDGYGDDTFRSWMFEIRSDDTTTGGCDLWEDHGKAVARWNPEKGWHTPSQSARPLAGWDYERTDDDHRAAQASA